MGNISQNFRFIFLALKCFLSLFLPQNWINLSWKFARAGVHGCRAILRSGMEINSVSNNRVRNRKCPRLLRLQYLPRFCPWASCHTLRPPLLLALHIWMAPCTECFSCFRWASSMPSLQGWDLPWGHGTPLWPRPGLPGAWAQGDENTPKAHWPVCSGLDIPYLPNRPAAALPKPVPKSTLQCQSLHILWGRALPFSSYTSFAQFRICRVPPLNGGDVWGDVLCPGFRELRGALRVPKLIPLCGWEQPKAEKAGDAGR